MEQQRAREAWLTKRLVRATTGQASEVRVDIPGLARFRIFRNPTRKSMWLTYMHREADSRTLERMSEATRDLLKYEFQGELENRHMSRASAITWLALHWDWVIDKAMREENE